MVIIPWVSTAEKPLFLCAYCGLFTRQSSCIVYVHDGMHPNAEKAHFVELDDVNEPVPPDVSGWLYPSCCWPCTDAARWVGVPLSQATKDQKLVAHAASTDSVHSAKLQASMDTIFRVRARNGIAI